MTLHHEQKVKYVAPAITIKCPYETLNRPYVGLEHIQSWIGEINLNADSAPEGVVALFEPNDILFGKLRPYLAKVALANFQGACSTEALVLRHRPGHSARYLRYVLSQKRFIDEVDSSTFGAKMPRASWEFIGSQVIPTPNLSTQEAIADFLDRETARIDQLIEKKKRLLELLTERWKSLVNAAVSRAIADAPAVVLQRFLTAICDGPFGSGLKSSHYVDSGVRVVRLQNIGSDQFIDDDLAFIDSDYYETLGDHDVLEGDLLVAGLGDEKYPVGRACVAPRGIEPAMVKADCFRLRFHRARYQHAFLAKYLSSSIGASHVARRSKGVTRSRINLDILSRLPIPLPSLSQQTLACEEIESGARSYVDAFVKIGRSIESLREFRTALLTNAVTGQIDVATWDTRGGTERRRDQIEEEVLA